MRIIAYGDNLKLDADLKEHAERRLQFALARFSRRIREVKVRLTDVNADRGGMDKRCHIVVHLIPRCTVVVEDLDLNEYAAVARAAERIGRSVARELRRKHEIRPRKHGRRCELAPWF